MKIRLMLIPLLSLFIVLTACNSKSEKEVSEDAGTKLEVKLTDDEYIEKLLTLFEDEKLLINYNENFVATEDMLNQEHYEKAKKIIEFDIQPETGNEEEGIYFPPNEMRTGKIIMFDNHSDMTKFKDETSELLLIYSLGVNTNEIYPILYFNEERNIVLVLNKFIPDTYIKKYKTIFYEVN
ncbi:hypothetical protein [Vagococcus martis]